MKKLSITLVILTMFGYFSQAQQVSLNSHYMINDFILNPAIAGSNPEYIPLTMTVRKQWAGFQGAPITQHFTTHADVGGDFGLGLHFFNDLTGPTRRSGFNLATSYGLQLDNKNEHRLRFGLSFVLFEHVFDRNKITYEQPYDPTIETNYNQHIIPDANFGMFYHKDSTIFGGFSVMHLVQSRRDLTSVSSAFENGINRMYYLYGGYNYKIDEDFTLRPSLLMQFQANAPLSFDVNTLVEYQYTYWGGVSYRFKDAVAIILGMNYNNFTFAYSYDITTSDIRRYSSGSHEITLGYKISNHGAKFMDKLIRKRSSF
jgi:type IX secretion system PorP/SprF family membrane protein